MALSKVIAHRSYDDAAYELFCSGTTLVFRRKSDGKLLVVPWSEDTPALFHAIGDKKRNFIGHTLADLVTDSKWLTPRQAGVKPKRPCTYEDDFLHAA